MNAIIIVLLIVVIMLFSYMIYIDRKEFKQVRDIKKELEKRFEVTKQSIH